MLIKNCIMITALAAFCLFSCDKKNPSEPDDSSVNISEITFDKTTLTVQDTVKIECMATASGTLHYKWEMVQGGTVYESGIIDRENQTDTFDWGKWIKWQPPSTGEWEIDVLAYLSSADHSSAGNGSWHVFYEYGNSGVTQHCFNYNEKGKLWDEITVMKNVGY
jgi:hypothetical protein